MGRQIDKNRQQEQLTPPEILAGLIWDRAVNSRDHLFKTPCYQFPCYIEYCHENQNDGFSLDCLYLARSTALCSFSPQKRCSEAHSANPVMVKCHLRNVLFPRATELKEKQTETGATSGNLSVQLYKLQQAGYIEVTKGFKGKMPQTVCSISNKGRDSFASYVEVLWSYMPTGGN